MENSKKIILGSQSPRRKSLLEGMGFNFSVVTAETDESFDSYYAPGSIVKYIADGKAKAIRPLIDPKNILITADSLVVNNYRILGKPQSEDEVYEMLLLLSDTLHEVYTGVHVSDDMSGGTFFDRTEVKFSSITEAEIAQYIVQGNPFDKAGAYGIQGWIGINKVEWIRGSYTNVMGLPTQKLYDKLSAMMIRTPHQEKD